MGWSINECSYSFLLLLLLSWSLSSSSLCRLKPNPGQFVALDYKNYCWIFKALLNFHALFLVAWCLSMWPARGQIDYQLNPTYTIDPLQYFITQTAALRNMQWPNTTAFCFYFCCLSPLILSHFHFINLHLLFFSEFYPVHRIFHCDYSQHRQVTIFHFQLPILRFNGNNDLSNFT